MTIIDPQAERLEACLERIAVGGLAEASRPTTDEDAELADLVRLAVRMLEVAPARAPAAYRAREQLVLQAHLAPSGRRRTRPLGPARWLLRLAGVLVAVVLATGTVVMASANSLPGDALYGVKRAAEGARLALAADPAARVRLRMALAGERVTEVRALVLRGVPLEPAAVAELVEAHRAILNEAQATGDPQHVAAALHTIQGDRQALSRLVGTAPPGAGAVLRAAITALDRLVTAALPAEAIPGLRPTSAPELAMPLGPTATETPFPTAQAASTGAPSVRGEFPTVPPTMAAVGPAGPTAVPGATREPSRPPAAGPPPPTVTGPEPTSRFKKQRDDDLATETARAAAPARTAAPGPTSPGGPMVTPPVQGTAAPEPGDRHPTEPPSATPAP